MFEIARSMQVAPLCARYDPLSCGSVRYRTDRLMQQAYDERIGNESSIRNFRKVEQRSSMGVFKREHSKAAASYMNRRLAPMVARSHRFYSSLVDLVRQRTGQS